MDEMLCLIWQMASHEHNEPDVPLRLVDNMCDDVSANNDWKPIL